MCKINLVRGREEKTELLCFTLQFKFVFHLYLCLFTKGNAYIVFTREFSVCFFIVYCHNRVLDLPHLKLPWIIL
jgi:hypothetical protein